MDAEARAQFEWITLGCPASRCGRMRGSDRGPGAASARRDSQTEGPGPRFDRGFISFGTESGAIGSGAMDRASGPSLGKAGRTADSPVAGSPGKEAAGPSDLLDAEDAVGNADTDAVRQQVICPACASFGPVEPLLVF